ncbi:MAG: adenylosuccinate lyase [Bdellovibrionaceae bacterium]|nr:adenylosuccinate lyase [Pseudobdellovibrionaceae bacterium]
MISRYTTPEMEKIWTEHNKFTKMKEVEVCVANVQAKMGLIPKSAAAQIKKKATFNIAKIKQIEKKTKHDVIAFVNNLAQSVGSAGQFIHYGLTSSDVLDTALNLQIKEAGKLLESQIKIFKKALLQKIKTHKSSLCVGRTHGMQAELTSFSYKLLSHYYELQRAQDCLSRSLKQTAVGQISGPVGNYSFLPKTLETKVCTQLKLKAEDLSTQVIPRDRYARLLQSISMLGGCLDRLAIELRHLQRSEVAEVSEGFLKGQKGSSAMPHKKNPISAENISGLTRLLKSYGQVAMDNISLWHERDISHSSVERVIIPDAFILSHYLLSRATNLVSNLQVDKQKMLNNIEISKGKIFSATLLSALVNKKWKRNTAYELLQKLSLNLKKEEHLKDKVLKEKSIMQSLSKTEINSIFNGSQSKARLIKLVNEHLKKL